MNRTARIGILLASAAIFCYAGIGHVLGRTPDDKAYKSLTVYGEVLQKIQSDYVDEPNMRLVTAGSLHGLLESLDAQSSYLTPREYTEYKQKAQSASTGETGLNLSKRFGYVIVISVLPDSPAEKAGIHSGDIFESVAGFTTRDMSVGQALNLLNGPAGSGVKVGVIRRGRAQPEEVDVVRQKLSAPKISAQTFAAEPGKVVWRNPVSILIDGTTSGAAEILASAIVANHRGDVVGERTFGLASEQKLITLDDGSALFLTVANYYNAGGKSILDDGVTPSEVVHAAAADDDNDVSDDASASPKEPLTGPRPLSPEDPVFHKALDLLKAPAKKAA